MQKENHRLLASHVILDISQTMKDFVMLVPQALLLHQVVRHLVTVVDVEVNLQTQQIVHNPLVACVLQENSPQMELTVWHALEMSSQPIQGHVNAILVVLVQKLIAGEQGAIYAILESFLTMTVSVRLAHLTP